MGLMPLEYKDCITDSPYFRQKLHSHEKELDRTSSAIKNLTKEVKDLVNAAKELSRAQRRLSQSLSGFKFECIGSSQTDDEIVIGSSLREFAKIVDMVEDERERMLDRSYDQIIAPLENFRKEAIGGAKEGRKKFEKQTFKFYQNQEKYLSLSTKKDDMALQEADASVDMEQRFFAQASLEYVFLLQEVQERKKFEFVETLLSYMYSWLTFYHQGHEVFGDCNPYLQDLQVRLQRTRENFMSTRQEAEQLKNKMLEKNSDPGSMDKMYTRQGYLFLMEKKAFGTTWTKHYCQYQKESRVFTMIPYNQMSQKIAISMGIHKQTYNTNKQTSTETLMLKTCVRRMSETIDKRFCFDLTAQDRDKFGLVYTLQALCENDRKLWMDAMDGKEPMYAHPSLRATHQDMTELDAYGLSFITRALATLEARGLEEQGLYRVVGVASKVARLLQMGLDPTRCGKLCLDEPSEWETKTITSAIKQYFRNLPEPLMTYGLHADFLAAAKLDNADQRVRVVTELVRKLPTDNRLVLKELVYHLCRVSSKHERNLMTVSNLGVCFGPTLLRPEEESVAAIMDIKFCNVVVELLVEHYSTIFAGEPGVVPHGGGASPGGGAYGQPLLQTVVTSFTTSEPQTVHFGGGHSTTAKSGGNPHNHGWTSSTSTLNIGAVNSTHTTSPHDSRDGTGGRARGAGLIHASSNNKHERINDRASTSSSSESICSRSSHGYHHHPHPHQPPYYSAQPSHTQKSAHPQHSSSSNGSSPPSSRPPLGTTYPATFSQHMET